MTINPTPIRCQPAAELDLAAARLEEIEDKAAELRAALGAAAIVAAELETLTGLRSVPLALWQTSQPLAGRLAAVQVDAANFAELVERVSR